MTQKFDEQALSQLFLSARSRNAWLKEKLDDSLWHELYNLLKMGPTSANVSPARFVFCTSDNAKSRVLRHMSNTNAIKSQHAPAIVIIAHDLDFALKLPELFPHNPSAQHWFSEPEMRNDTAFRNGTLQGAYLLMAARALGLDCGPMSGFDQNSLDEDFFSGTAIKSNFLCALGHGIDEPLPRLPRLRFEQACEVL